MSAHPRFVPPGIYFTTMRTNARRMHFRPSAALNAAILGIIGRALSLYPVTIHAMVWMSNHWHALLSACDAEATTDFMRYVHSQTAKAAQRINGVKGKVWRNTPPSIIPVLGERAQLKRLEYILAHGTKERLVASPLLWPGVHCAGALASNTPLFGDWIDYTKKQQLSRRRTPHPGEYTTRYRIDFEPLPALAPCSPEERIRAVQQMIDRIVEQNPGPHLGVEAVLAMDPNREPATPEFERQAPAVFTSNPTLHERYIRLRDAFRAAYRRAAELHEQRPTQVTWPLGNFLPACQFARNSGDGGFLQGESSLMSMLVDETHAPPVWW